MGTLTERIEQATKYSAKSGYEVEGFGQVNDREKAIIDRHKSELPSGSLMQKIALGGASIEIDTRRQQRAYAEKAPSEMAAPVKEMLSNLGDRGKVLDAYRKLSPEQRKESLKLAPGISQQLGDDRGGIVGRTLGAVSRGISHGVSQPIQELAGQVTGADWGGTTEEIAFIRKLDTAASQEFSPARPGDPWYQRGPLQATEMAPWMATVVGGAGLGRAAATGLAGRVATSAAAGTKVAGAVQKVGQAVGKLPTKVPVVGKYLPAVAAGKVGELAGITAAAFPGQYAQEVDQLKALGMVDDTRLRLLAGGTAAITGLVEGLVPNPFKGGQVSLTEGATKAARQYLWNAAKNAPGELTEEYLQGVTSGLGEHVAQYIGSEVDGKNPAKKKSIEDAFRKGWEQTTEAALPMAFLLGVPAVGGAGLAAARARGATTPSGTPPTAPLPAGATLGGANPSTLPTQTPTGDTMSQTTPPPVTPVQPPPLKPTQTPPVAPSGQPLVDRAEQLKEIISKGFVSKDDAASLEIAGTSRKERWANANNEIEELQAKFAQEQVVTDEPEAESQYAQEIARRRAAKAGTQPPIASGAPPVRDIVSQIPPVKADSSTVPVEDISKIGGAIGGGIVDGLYNKVWSDVQSGSLEKMDKPPLFEQLVLRGHKAGVVKSVEDVRSISDGFTGDFETDKKLGIDNLNRLATKYKEKTPTPVTPPAEPAPEVTSSDKPSGQLPFLTPEWRSKREAERTQKLGSGGRRNPEVAARKEVDEEIAAMQTYPPGTELEIKGYKGSLFRVEPDGSLLETNSRRGMGDNAGAVLRNYKPDQIKVVSKPKVESTEKVPPVDPAANVEDPQASVTADTQKLPVRKDPLEPAKSQDAVPEASSVPAPVVTPSAPPTKTAGRKDAPKAPQESPQKQVGVNSLGQSVFEDGDGVRSVLDGDARITEPVSYVVTPRGGPNNLPQRTRDKTPHVNKDLREDRFKTTEEKQPKSKSGDIVSQEHKRDQEVKDAPQTKKGGGPNEVQTDGRQRQTNANANAEAEAKAQGQVSPKGEQAAGGTPSSASSVEDLLKKWIRSNKNEKGYIGTFADQHKLSEEQFNAIQSAMKTDPRFKLDKDTGYYPTPEAITDIAKTDSEALGKAAMKLLDDAKQGEAVRVYRKGKFSFGEKNVAVDPKAAAENFAATRNQRLPQDHPARFEPRKVNDETWEVVRKDKPNEKTNSSPMETTPSASSVPITAKATSEPQKPELAADTARMQAERESKEQDLGDKKEQAGETPSTVRKPPELQSPSEYRATLTKPTIKAIDLATSQLTDVEIEHDVLESILVNGLKQNNILTQERRESAWLKQLLKCLES